MKVLSRIVQVPADIMVAGKCDAFQRRRVRSESIGHDLSRLSVVPECTTEEFESRGFVSGFAGEGWMLQTTDAILIHPTNAS